MYYFFTNGGRRVFNSAVTAAIAARLKGLDVFFCDLHGGRVAAISVDKVLQKELLKNNGYG